MTKPENVPGVEECLVCFLERMLEKHGCDGSLRFTTRWRQARGADDDLEEFLRVRGGFCDCEAVMNVFAAPAQLDPSSVY